MPEWMMRSLTDTYTYTCQLEPQERPVDKFHFDYVPFVFVTMLRKVRDGREPNGWVRAGECEPTYQRNHDVQARGDDTGKLVLQPSDGEQQGGKIALALEPGESVLLQGAHVLHQANQSQLGCRVSLVTSLAPASVLLPDTTRVGGWVNQWVGRDRMHDDRSFLPSVPPTLVEIPAHMYNNNRSAATPRPSPRTRPTCAPPSPIARRAFVSWWRGTRGGRTGGCACPTRRGINKKLVVVSSCPSSITFTFIEKKRKPSSSHRNPPQSPIETRLVDEFARWLLQFDGSPSSAAAAPFFNEEVRGSA